MPLSRRSLLIIGAAILALVLAGVGWYFFLRQPEPIVFKTYLCEDQSFYLVLMQKEAIGVAGKLYPLVSNENGMRYENGGYLAFTITGQELKVSGRETGSAIATCIEGELETPPVVEQ